MFYGLYGGSDQPSSINLQATLSAATAMGLSHVVPHHPITCQGELGLHDDGSLECEHVRTGAGDVRTQDALAASVAILLFELVHARFGSTPRTT